MKTKRELYKKHRPKSLKRIIGQPNAVRLLEVMFEEINIPHTFLFSGPSGCGKTTLARIVKNKLGCGKLDFEELNCADVRGIDGVRRIRNRIQSAPISGDCRVWLIDEAHKLTNDAQNAFLKMLEDTPDHVYFMLATTHPQKLLNTIRTRCTEITVKVLNYKAMGKLIRSVAKREGIKLLEILTDEVVDKIIECSEGSARKALVLLNQIRGLKKEEDILEAIQKSATEQVAINIARALLNPRTKWPEMVKFLKGFEEDSEDIRWMVLGYANKVLLSGGKYASRAYLIIVAFRDHFYESKFAGLTAACYEVIVGAKE